MPQRTFKGIREDLGLNQDEMAEKLGLKNRYVLGDIESGRTKTPAGVFVALLELAGISDYRDLKIPRDK